MSTERWRLFVAVPLGEELRRDLAAAVDEWRNRPDLAGLRWTDPDSWHVTLAFLGAVDPTQVPQLSASLADVAARHEAMRLGTGGLGAFPSPSRARVAWYGVLDRQRRLASLANEVRSNLRVDGGPFRAHVTLGRARNEPMALQSWLADATAPAGDLLVDRLRLMRSHLNGGPARHELIVDTPLGEPSRV